jgi:Tol biopolymer transport system component/DNA-binding winged helix-turn-helix (wHTH) protein
MKGPNPSRFRFSVFELDVRSGELRKNGSRVRVQEKPVQLLTALVKRPGEVVSREELREGLWPGGVHVDFDRGLAKALVKLREVLDDSAETPRFIETLPRHGYRFLYPVCCVDADQVLPLDGQPSISISAGTDIPQPSSRFQKRLIWVLFSIAVTALVFLLAHFLPLHSEKNRVSRLLIESPEQLSNTGSLAVSPDGSYIAFTTVNASGKDQIWVRPLDSLTAQHLSGTDDAENLFWSPDSRFLAFFAHGKLKITSVSGGSPRILTPASDTGVGAWSRNGIILFGQNPSGTLFSIPASGGSPREVTERDRSHEIGHASPTFLADDEHFLYFIGSTKRGASGIYIGSLHGKDKKQLLATDFLYQYSGGYLLFLRGQTLMGQRLDASRMGLIGEPEPIADSIWYDPSNGGQGFSLSSNGVLAYRIRSPGDARLVWFDRNGKKLTSVDSSGDLTEPALSPDEKRIAVGTGGSINIIDLTTHVTSQFTNGDDSGLVEQPAAAEPLWSPDGKWVAFLATQGANWDLYRKPSNNVGKEELLFRGESGLWADDWSRDGAFISLEAVDPKTGIDLWVLPLNGQRKLIPFMRTPFNEYQSVFSPNGKLMAYVSDKSGTIEVYVTDFPSASGHWQVSANGGAQPSWRGDGKELFYVSPDKKLMSVQIQKDSHGFRAKPPMALFQTQIAGMVHDRNYYVPTRDGQRFLVLTPSERDAHSPLYVVLNWEGLLKH